MGKSYSFQKLHIQANLGGKGKITQVEATLDDIFPADGPKEFWYAPKGIEKKSEAVGEGKSTAKKWLKKEDDYKDT